MPAAPCLGQGFSAGLPAVGLPGSLSSARGSAPGRAGWRVGRREGGRSWGFSPRSCAASACACLQTSLCRSVNCALTPGRLKLALEVKGGGWEPWGRGSAASWKAWPGQLPPVGLEEGRPSRPERNRCLWRRCPFWLVQRCPGPSDARDSAFCCAASFTAVPPVSLTLKGGESQSPGRQPWARKPLYSVYFGDFYFSPQNRHSLQVLTSWEDQGLPGTAGFCGGGVERSPVDQAS